MCGVGAAGLCIVVSYQPRLGRGGADAARTSAGFSSQSDVTATLSAGTVRQSWQRLRTRRRGQSPGVGRPRSDWYTSAPQQQVATANMQQRDRAVPSSHGRGQTASYHAARDGRTMHAAGYTTSTRREHASGTFIRVVSPAAAYLLSILV